MFLHNVLGRKIYPTLLRPRTFVHYSFPKISSRPEGLPKSPRPRLFKPEWASNVRRQFYDFRKKHFYTWCAGLIVHALLTISSIKVVRCTARGGYIFWDMSGQSTLGGYPCLGGELYSGRGIDSHGEYPCIFLLYRRRDER
jgi:hypothetical protein